ncbi:Branched-chain amino acid aminotransferase [Raineya orbicola]|uniref:branched-chain-amino-acid transaminase n=2 Tax=Raineya orbicola TaxID=2016530 RepID=A0A2N3IH61_9BACT|nr:Branched-chain amino acid aminotransferase [Raineya orbicola]
MIETLPLEIELTSQSRIDGVDFENLGFGRVFSDHMLVAEYKNGEWVSAKVMPYGNLYMSPAMSVLHYGQSIFEGLKAQYMKDGRISVFRPWENHKRMLASAERMCMPAVPEDLFIGGIKQLIEIDKKWIPKQKGASLYIRPFMFASEEFLGVRPSQEYKFIIFTCPVGNYYSEPVRLKIETHYSRVAQGGIGCAKTAGNYAASLYGAVKVQKMGYHQALWTNSLTHEYIEEVGTMNIMFRIGNRVLTPELGDTILKGVTRDSVLTLAREWGYEVEERKVSVKEIAEALQNGMLDEAFGLGTAAVVAHVKVMHYDGKDYELPPLEKRTLANKIYDYLIQLRNGDIEDTHNWLLIL